MSKFTRGNWELNSRTGDISSKGTLIAKVYGATDYNVEKNAEESFANARLITASPEMYDELYEALQLLKGKSSCESDEFARQARSIEEVLVRVEGKEE